MKTGPKTLLALIAILLFFVGTRLFRISEIPAANYWDEASIGYNAYAISKDFKDEWGKFMPLHFRAFGEFKLPVYIYVTSIFVKIFGLTSFSVRLPAVLFSLLTVFLTFLIGRKLFKNTVVPLLASFFLTTSPWFFIFSRTGYEASAGIAFFVLGVYFFLLSFEKEKFLLIAFISWAISLYSYNSFRIIVPTFALVSFIYLLAEKRRKSRNFWFILFGSIAVLALSFVPIFRLLTREPGISRFEIVRERSLIQITKNYFSHFDLNFLLNGDTNPRSQIPGFGQVWIFDLPLFVLGVISLIKRKKDLFLLPLILLILAPVPAAITRESPHALRSILAPFALALLWASGVEYIAGVSKKFKTTIIVGSIIASLAFFENYADNFFTLYNFKSSKDWQYGYMKIFEDYKDKFANYRKVIISDEYGQPYIFALFYLRYGPSLFRQTVKYNPPDKWGFSTVSSFNNFEFKKVGSSDIARGSLVFAAPEEKIGLTSKREIKFADGETAFFVYEK